MVTRSELIGMSPPEALGHAVKDGLVNCAKKRK